MKKIIMSLLLLVLGNCFAATTSTTNKATATMSASCQINATNLNFGNLMLGKDNYATMTINSVCSRNLPYTIGIDLGSRNNRTMIGAVKGEVLSYKICQIPWTTGDSCPTPYRWNSAANIAVTGDGNVLSTTGTGSTQVFTGYGWQLLAYPTPDNYSDSATITLSY